MYHRGEGGSGYGKELFVSLEGIMEHKRMDFICSHHSFCFVEFADDFQSVGVQGEYWGLHPRWGALSLDMYMQFLQGTDLQNSPNLEAWVSSGAPSGAGCHWNPEELSCGGDGMDTTVTALHLASLWRARKLSVWNIIPGWYFKWEQKKFAGCSFTGSAEAPSPLCVSSEQCSEVKRGGPKPFCRKCGDFKRDSFPPISQAQTESKHANPSQICSVQLTCALSFLSKLKGNCSGSLLREDKIPDFFFSQQCQPSLLTEDCSCFKTKIKYCSPIWKQLFWAKSQKVLSAFNSHCIHEELNVLTAVHGLRDFPKV